MTLAFEVFPVPPFVELTVTELFCVPPMIASTFTENVQFPPAARLPPVRLTVVDPAVAVAVPPQVFVSAFGVATTNPEGKVSANATPVRGTVVFGFEIEKVRLVLVPNRIEAAPNVLVIEGGPTTVMLAVPELPVPPFVELTVTELFCTPRVVPVTLTENVQLALPASVAPDRLTELDPGVAVIVPPPQAPVKLLGAETTNPDGSESVRAMPVTETAFGFVTVKLRIAVPPTGIVGTLKAFPIDGGSTTVSVAVLEVVPVPPWVELIAPVVLFITPPVDAVTFTEIVQLPLAATVPLERLTEEDAAVAVTVPPQVLDTPGVVATANPAGRVSEKEIPVEGTAFGFVMVKARLVLPFSGIEVAPKDLLMVGGISTVSVAVLEVLPVPPSFEEIVPVVLFFTPSVVPVTFSDIVQVPVTAMLPPDRVTEEDAAAAVTIPPQLLTTPGVTATTNPLGSESEKEIPVKPVAFGFVMVNCKVVLPLSRMDAAPKDLLIVGEPITASLAVEGLPLPPLLELTETVLL
jgi:hypothetical protein